MRTLRVERSSEKICYVLVQFIKNILALKNLFQIKITWNWAYNSDEYKDYEENHLEQSKLEDLRAKYFVLIEKPFQTYYVKVK